jgi:hypothetical protein
MISSVSPLQVLSVRRSAKVPESMTAMTGSIGLDDTGEPCWHIAPRGLDRGPFAAHVRAADLAR